MPLPRLARPRRQLLRQLRRAGRILSIGSGVPMIPVEQTSTCAASMPERLGRAAAHRLGIGEPGAPVPALALPLN
jgi:hypothetical protein